MYSSACFLSLESRPLNNIPDSQTTCGSSFAFIVVAELAVNKALDSLLRLFLTAKEQQPEPLDP